jgi:hypothetical protein
LVGAAVQGRRLIGRGVEVFIASGAWAGFLGDFVGVVPVRAGLGWAVGCGDPGGCELLVISAGWIARGSGARAGPPARGQEARGRGEEGRCRYRVTWLWPGGGGRSPGRWGFSHAGLQGVHTLSLQGVGSLQSPWGR